MSESKWAWFGIFSATSVIAGASYFRIGLYEIVKFGLSTVLRAGLLFCVLYIIGSRLYGIYSKWNQTKNVSDQTYTTPTKDGKIEQARSGLQSQYDGQAGGYKERILDPREDARRRKKDEEYYRFMGPAWKGKGQELGGEDLRLSPTEGAKPDDGSVAREVRKLPDDVRLHVPREEQASSAKQRVILPDEPSPDTADVTLIVLRSPLGTSHSRRFLNQSKLQVVFDYMTTLGFSKRKFTLSRSYPRQPLTDQSEDTLIQLDFGKQIVLNIEEISD